MTDRYAKYAWEMAFRLFQEGQDSEAAEILLNLPKVARELAERDTVRIQNDYPYDTIYLTYGKISRSNGAVAPYLTAFALSKRLRRKIEVPAKRIRGKALYIAIAREFAYLPAFQYMYDNRLQMPEIWERALLSQELPEQHLDEMLKGVSFRIGDVYEVTFYPFNVGRSLTSNNVAMRYLRSLYNYLQKVSRSKLSALMSTAFGGDISVDYVVTPLKEIADQSDSAVVLLLTVPRVYMGRILPAVKLLIRVRMVNGARIHFVSNVVTTCPVLFIGARRYLPDAPSMNVVISPTTLTILLTEFRRSANGEK